MRAPASETVRTRPIAPRDRRRPPARASARRPAARPCERRRAHLRVAQPLDVPLPAVIPEEAQEAERERLLVEGRERLELVLERRVRAGRGLHEELGHGAVVEEAQAPELALELGRQRAHAPDPLVLERMVLRL